MPGLEQRKPIWKLVLTGLYMHGTSDHLPDDKDRDMRKAAKSANVSSSKWVAERVAPSVETSWPREFLALAGAFPDFPDADELRKGCGEDVPRESLGEKST